MTRQEKLAKLRGEYELCLKHRKSTGVVSKRMVKIVDNALKAEMRQERREAKGRAAA